MPPTLGKFYPDLLAPWLREQTASKKPRKLMVRKVVTYLPDEVKLEEVIVATKGHGGRFVLASGLTMSGPQAERVWRIVDRHFPQARPAYERLYANGTYAPPRSYSADLGRRVRTLCEKHSLADRMPR